MDVGWVESYLCGVQCMNNNMYSRLHSGFSMKKNSKLGYAVLNATWIQIVVLCIFGHIFLLRCFFNSISDEAKQCLLFESDAANRELFISVNWQCSKVNVDKEEVHEDYIETIYWIILRGSKNENCNEIHLHLKTHFLKRIKYLPSKIYMWGLLS